LNPFVSRRAHLVSDARNPAAPSNVKVQQDVNIFVSELEPGRELALNLETDRQAYVLCVEGSLGLATSAGEEVQLVRHEASELYGESGVEFKFRNSDNTTERAHVLIVEMQKDGSGRQDL
jgi:redox-sensitive bicupin YhaK (pirin superfamily)